MNPDPSILLIREAVRDAIRTGRSFHDYWYYTMSFTQHALFSGFREFENRADAAYCAELSRLNEKDLAESASIEMYWQAKQGGDYGSY